MVSKKIFYLGATNILISGILFISPAISFAQTQSVPFFVESQYDATQRTEITATLQQISERAYFFVDDGWWDGLSLSEKSQALNSISTLASEFDNSIYKKLTSFFGDIWSPGIDNDPKITVLLLPLAGKAGGYINYSDEYPKNIVARSNEREMVYLNTDHLNKSIEKSFLAHEFQHLITFYQKDKLRGIPEDIWLNEARSEYSSSYLGYDDNYSGSNLENRVNSFVENSSDPLCEFKSDAADYGSVNIFMQYLAEKYGSETIAESIKDEKAGIESINNALKKEGYNVSFQDVFANWAIANFLNNCSAGDAFCYKNPNLNKSNLHVGFNNASITPSLQDETAVKDWQPIFYQFDPVGTLENTFLKLYFEKEDLGELFKVPYIIENTDGSFLIKYMDISQNKSTVYIPDFGKSVKSVAAIPFKQTKINNFSTDESSFKFNLSADLTEEEPPKVPEKNIVRATGDQRIYLIENNKRHWIPNPEIFAIYNLNWSDVKEITIEELNSFSRVKLLKARGGYEVYYLTESGLLRHFPSAEAFVSYGNKWEDILEIDEREVLAYEINDLIKLEEDPKVYKIEDGKKGWIKTASAFNRLKYDWSKIAPVNQTELNAYPEGKQIY